MKLTKDIFIQRATKDKADKLKRKIQQAKDIDQYMLNRASRLGRVRI